MVFYSICIVFSNSNPILLLAGIYLFLIRHFGDFTSLLTVHLSEIDSNGKFINKLINYAIVPILLFHSFMIFDCLNHDKYIEAGIVGFIMILSMIYYYIAYESDYMMAIYSYNKQLDHYQNHNINMNNLSGSGFNIQSAVANNEIIKWNNKYRHPLIIPAFVNDQENESNLIRPSYPRDSKRRIKKDESLSIRSFEPKNRSDE